MVYKYFGSAKSNNANNTEHEDIFCQVYYQNLK